MCNSTTFALWHTQILLSGILRHFRPPSRHLLLNTHDTNMEFLQLNGPLLDIFLFFSKTKIFHSHPWLKGAVWNFCGSSLCAVNCLQFAWPRGQGKITCRSHATHWALITHNILCTTWYEGTAQLSSWQNLYHIWFSFISVAETI